jgi:hypothetical protein
MFHVILDSNAVKKEFDAPTKAWAMAEVRTDLPQAELLDRDASQKRWPAKAQEYWNAHPNTVGLIANGDDHAGCIVNRSLKGRREASEQRPGGAGGKGGGRGGAGRG